MLQFPVSALYFLYHGSFIEAARIELFDDIVKGLIDAVDNTKIQIFWKSFPS